ncbi:MAG: InlB B-repeat-containing protein, partial [Anaeroplasmataceae bacterium]|nr:InlB B-repeat-containing protein [Anaeroplasmataceae bacterium]
MKKIRRVFMVLVCICGFLLIGLNLTSCNKEVNEPQEEKVLYKVHFNSMGGSLVSSQSIEDGDKIIEPENPQKTDYNFCGWYKSEECLTPWNFDFDIVESNITLYAKWEPVIVEKKYQVEFNSHGGSSISKIENISFGDKIKVPSDPIKEGYVFDGWYQDEDYLNKWSFATGKVEKDMTLHAKWKKLCTVTFDSNEGSMVSPLLNVVSETKINAPENPTKEGYVFAGWYLEKECLKPWNFDGDVVIDNITLYAKWGDENAYHNVVFKGLNDEILKSMNVLNGTSAIPPLNPSTTGYKFVRWEGDYTSVTEDRVIEAVYLRHPETVEIHMGLIADTQIYFEGEVVATNQTGALLKDNTGYILVYSYSVCNYDLGDIIGFSAVISTYGEKKQLINPTEIERIGHNSYVEPIIRDIYSVDAYLKNFEVGDYVSFQGQLVVVNNHYNITLESQTYALSLATPKIDLTEYVNRYVIVEGYALYISYNYFNIMLSNITEDNVPTHTVTYIDEFGEVIETQTIYENHASIPPLAPTKEGYKFIDWDGGDYNCVTEDLILRPIYKSISETISLSILEINDLHGYLEKDNGISGISNMAYLIDSIRKEPGIDDVVLIGNGDMFQGTGISNITRGQAVIDCMNMLGFDAMGLGNHEFDWGLEEILKYFDGDESNGEANFPLLNANVYYASTNELVIASGNNMFNYRIVDKSGVKVAILSYIGNIKSSIAYERAMDYEFDNDIAASVQKIATPLKENGIADVVIVNIHGGNSSGVAAFETNQSLAELTWSKGYLVDAVINGHTHTKYNGSILRDGVEMPVVQAQSYCKYLGRIDLTYDLTLNRVVSASSSTIENSKLTYDEAVEETLVEAIERIDNEEYCILKDRVSYTSDLRKWHGYTAINALGADVFISNTGGIRATGGIKQGEMINLFHIYEISPFDNVIFLVKTTKSAISRLLSSSSIFYVTKDDMVLEDSNTYTFAIISYVYYWSQLDYVRSNKDINTNLVIRDLLIEDLRYRRDHQIDFSPVSNPNSVLG